MELETNGTVDLSTLAAAVCTFPFEKLAKSLPVFLYLAQETCKKEKNKGFNHGTTTSKIFGFETSVVTSGRT